MVLKIASPFEVLSIIDTTQNSKGKYARIYIQAKIMKLLITPLKENFKDGDKLWQWWKTMKIELLDFKKSELQF